MDLFWSHCYAMLKRMLTQVLQLIVTDRNISKIPLPYEYDIVITPVTSDNLTSSFVME